MANACFVDDAGPDGGTSRVFLECPNENIHSHSVESRVRVQQEDEGGRPSAESFVARMAEAAVLVQLDRPHGQRLDCLQGVIGGGAVDDDHVCPGQTDERLYAGAQLVAAVVRDDDDVDADHRSTVSASARPDRCESRFS